MRCHLLSSLRKLRDWSLAFVMALLPQHLIAQLGNADHFSVATYAAQAVPIVNTAIPSAEESPSAATRDDGAATQAKPTR